MLLAWVHASSPPSPSPSFGCCSASRQRTRGRAIAFAFISVWTLLAALLYVTPRTGSQTSPSGTIPNHAHLHAGAAIATGLGFTLLCAACCALMMYLKSRGDD
jgi:hypothetical protein